MWSRLLTVLTPKARGNVIVAWHEKAGALYARFERDGDRNAAEQAMRLFRRMAGIGARGDPYRIAALNNLSGALQHRFTSTGNLTDLDEAVVLGRAAVEASPDADVNRSIYRSNLGNALRLRFKHIGDLADLDEAIALGRPTGPGTADAADLSNLGLALHARYDYIGELADLDEAIAVGRAAVAAAEPDGAGRATYLANLGAALVARFERSRARADIDEAVTISRTAFEMDPSDPSDRSVARSALAAALCRRYEETRDPDDLNEAVEHFRRVVELLPPGNYQRQAALSNLGAALQFRFDATGDPTDLDDSLAALQAAQEAAPPGDPDRSRYMANLGFASWVRFRHGGRPDDTEHAMRSWRAVAQSATTPARVRAAAGRSWGRLAAIRGDADAARDAYALAVRLLPVVAWHGLGRASQEEHLADWASLTTDAAAWCIATGDLERAVELLEQGRSVLWSRLLHMRSELSALTERHPDLAAELDALHTALNAGTASAQPLSAVDERIRRARRFDELTTQVRRLPGFAHFLAPTPFEALRDAGAAGPVVIINASGYRCDALAVTPVGVRLIPLPELTLATAADRANAYLDALHRREHGAGQPAADLTRTLATTLEWLWDTTVEPVLHALGYRHRPLEGTLPRLWWCPTGPLAVLPLHAAGKPDGAGQAAVDRVVSSYAVTLGGLVRARSVPAVGGPAVGGPPRLLAVAVPHAPGLTPLPAAATEIQMVARSFPDPTILTGPDARRHNVLEEMDNHDWVHFACHGSQDLNAPTRGAIHLYDGPLTVLQVAGRRPSHPELAFLSACQTATTGVRLPDEAIHLAAALHFVGYRHVIATLWSVGDRHALEVAGVVYRLLSAAGGRTASGAAEALHHAVVKLRRRYPTDPSTWTPYIHLGA
jgi:tetratricopeptide (TPR) repeat protein